MAATLAAAAILTPAAAAVETEPVRSADSLIDSIGINTHTFFNDTGYYSGFDLMKRKLAELGVRHVREDLMPNRPDQYERLNELASIGVRSTLILGDPDDGLAELDRLSSILSNELRGAVEAVEGPNEFDMRGGADWLPRLQEYQQRLYHAIKDNPSLSTLPVIGPSIVQRRNQEALGDISGSLEFGNIHPYPDGYSPESNLEAHLQRAANNSGSEPVVATETGYHTTDGWTGEHQPTSEQAMAAYMPRIYLEYFRRGVARTYGYELLDQKPDRSERENNFGLLRNDFSEKPAFVALRNLIDILEDPGPKFEPAQPTYRLDGDTENLHHVLLQKRDGNFYLALWRARDVWDPAAQRDLQSSTGRVNLDFDQPVLSATTYLPNASSAPIASLRTSANGPLGLNVGPQVAIVKLKLGRRIPSRIKLWVSKRIVRAGGHLAVRGRLPAHARGRSQLVAVQHWRGDKRGGWRTVGRKRTWRNGVFRRAMRISPARFGRVPRLRVVARAARPSRIVRLRIRRQGMRTARLGLSRARAVPPTAPAAAAE